MRIIVATPALNYLVSFVLFPGLAGKREKGASETHRRPMARMHARDILVRRFICRFHIRAMGSRPRTQSDVKETTECAMLASGTAAGFMQCPFSPLYSA